MPIRWFTLNGEEVERFYPGPYVEHWTTLNKTIIRYYGWDNRHYLHRLDGPAVENSDGVRMWYVKGKYRKDIETIVEEQKFSIPLSEEDKAFLFLAVDI